VQRFVLGVVSLEAACAVPQFSLKAVALADM
jgi:hypothetical protein